METLKQVSDGNTGRQSRAEPINRVRLGDERSIVSGTSHKSCHLYEVAGNSVTFKDCDFSYSVIERSYFRNATFENCRFVGARIVDSNFRSANFVNCDFQYAIVQRSILPVSELLRNLPDFPNVRREFLQQLRANAISVGDPSLVNQLVSKELEAERDYWRDARKRSTAYYEKKYGSIGGMVRANWQALVLVADRFIWGHGESIGRLIISTIAAILLLAMIRWMGRAPGEVQDLRVGDLWAAVRFTWEVYLDLPIAVGALDGHLVWGSTVVLVRYLTIGLFISVVFRKLSKR